MCLKMKTYFRIENVIFFTYPASVWPSRGIFIVIRIFTIHFMNVHNVPDFEINVYLQTKQKNITFFFSFLFLYNPLEPSFSYLLCSQVSIKLLFLIGGSNEPATTVVLQMNVSKKCSWKTLNTENGFSNELVSTLPGSKCRPNLSASFYCPGTKKYYILVRAINS